MSASLISEALYEKGLIIAGYSCDDEDLWVLTPDPSNLACFSSWISQEDCSGLCQAAELLKETSGLWGHYEWLLARAGLVLGIIDRAEARAIARSWACEDAPDERVLPGFLLYPKE